MTTFETPEPILATVEVGLGQVQINASDRRDTVVEVRPTDPESSDDVDAAGRVRVDFAKGELAVVAPRSRALRSLFGRLGSVDVVVDLPQGSRVHAKVVGSIRCDGHLGESQVESAVGSVRLDRVDRPRIRTGAGDVSLSQATGRVDVATATGRVRLDHVDGSIYARSANGPVDVGGVTGDVRLTTANGDITVERALATVVARTAHGSIRIGEVVQGSVVAESGFGELEIGIKPGTAAWIDARSKFGRVRSDLDATDAPEPSDDTVQVRAHTGFGDVVIHRSVPAPS